MNWKKAFLLAAILSSLIANMSHAAELLKNEWLVRLKLTSEAEGLTDSYNVLGQREGAKLGYDKHDLPELGQTFTGTYLSVIFYRPDWVTDDEADETNSGMTAVQGADGEWVFEFIVPELITHETYNRDIHPLAKSDAWTFEVRSDDPYRDLSLTWEGDNTNLENMVLVDLEEEDVFVPAVIDGQIQTYYFRINGNVHQFAWRVLTNREYKRLARAGKLAGTDATQTKKSNWLPNGWEQGQRNGHTIPDDLPDDPFSD